MKNIFTSQLDMKMPQVNSFTSGCQTETACSFAPPGDRILIINDMQTGFPASNDESVLGSIEREINIQIEMNGKIIVVEYEPNFFGKTHARLRGKLENYPFALFVTKEVDRKAQRQMRGNRNRPVEVDDGSQFILEACLDNGYSLDNFSICGVNTPHCVLDTVKGLREKLPDTQITVITDACNSEMEETNWQDFLDLNCLLQ